MEELPNEPLKPLPESKTIEDGIQEVCQHTVVTFLRIGVVVSMMLWGLKEANALQQRDDVSIFSWRAMSPFVNLICVGAQNDKEPHLPSKESADPCDRRNPHRNIGSGALNPTVAREISRVVMMQDVGLGDESAANRPLLAAISILEPMKQPGDKIGDQHGDDNFKNNLHINFPSPQRIGSERYPSLLGRG